MGLADFSRARSPRRPPRETHHEKIGTMSHIALIYYPGATAKSSSVVASVVADARGEGHEVTVLDISAFTVINQALPPRWVCRLLGHDAPEDALENELQSLGARILSVTRRDQELDLTPGETEQVDTAITSELLTYFRTDNLAETGARGRRLRRQLREQSEQSFAALVTTFQELSLDRVLIPNGRTSRQRVARVCAERLGIPYQLYENGRALADTYYLGSTQPHDRIASQKEVASLTQTLTSQEITTLAQSFLASRISPGKGSNQYSASWAREKVTSDSASELPLASFFPSSFDEFLAFGDMWHIDEWTEQFQAFDIIMSHLEDLGYRLEMRLHPNLGNKSRKYFRREVSQVKKLTTRHPQLVVHWHNSPQNSYDLVRRSALVFVERSTVGLEASLMGKPVWVSQAAQWDHIADIRALLKRSDIVRSALEPWAVDVSGAERFAAYWVMQERPLRYSWRNWATWNPEAAPLALRIANLFTRNTVAHKIHLLKVQWDSALNQKHRAPVRSSAGRLGLDS